MRSENERQAARAAHSCCASQSKERALQQWNAAQTGQDQVAIKDAAVAVIANVSSWESLHALIPDQATTIWLAAGKQPPAKMA